MSSGRIPPPDFGDRSVFQAAYRSRVASNCCSTTVVMSWQAEDYWVGRRAQASGSLRRPGEAVHGSSPADFAARRTVARFISTVARFTRNRCTVHPEPMHGSFEPMHGSPGTDARFICNRSRFTRTDSLLICNRSRFTRNRFTRRSQPVAAPLQPITLRPQPRRATPRTGAGSRRAAAALPRRR